MSRGRNAIVATGLVAFAACGLAFPFYMATLSKKQPVIDSSKPLPPQATFRGPYINTGSRDVGPDHRTYQKKFSPTDTNDWLRELEKCGVILKHIPGLRNAKWMSILYQNLAGAQRALSKNGMQLNGVLIVGVKPVDQNTDGISDRCQLIHHCLLSQISEN